MTENSSKDLMRPARLLVNIQETNDRGYDLNWFDLQT